MKMRGKGTKLRIRGKILAVFLLIIIMSTAVTGYLGLNILDSANKVAVSITKEELISSAESNLMSLAENKAHEAGGFYSEVASDTAGSASYVYLVFTNDTYANLTYKGDIYANFGYADWKHAANRSRINGILNGTISDPLYDELLALCGDANDTKLNDALKMLAEGSYAELPESATKARMINITLWSKLMSVNKLVKAKSEKGICDQFLLYKFMYGLLTKEAQNEIDYSLIAGETLRSQIDSHENYDMVRVSYWGNTTYSTALLYSKTPVKVPPPFLNTHYCQKNKAVREKGLGPVWSVIGCAEEPSMSCTVPVCRAPLEPLSEENKMIGAVTYWTDLTTLSASIANITVEETGYAFMVNEKGLAIAHPDSRMLEIDLTAGETEFNTTVKKMVEGRSGVEMITHEGKTFYIAYAPVDITGGSIALMVPFEEVIQPAMAVASGMDRKINTLYLYLGASTILIMLGVALVGYVFARRLTKPITELAEGTKAISRGDFDFRAEIKTGDEIEQLANSFNEMVAGLKEKTDELRGSEERFRALVESTSDWVWEVDINGVYTYASPKIKDLLGYKPEELIGKTTFDFMPPDEAKRIAAEFKAIAEVRRPFQRLENTNLHTDGRLVVLETSGVPIFDANGKFRGYRGIDRNITERKRAEEALQKAHDELEVKVTERTKELAEANIHLQELDRLKSMFIASMSHELRTPLNSIIGFTGIILMGMTGEITEEQRKQLTMVKNNAKHLLALINDVIDVSKIEAGKIELAIEEFDLSALVQEVKDSFAVAVAEKGLKMPVKMPERLVIESDERRTKQILMNFVSNAVKFTDKGQIAVNVVKNDKMAEVSVRDTGIGIRKEDIDKLFKAFSRIPTEGMLKEGTGLGLYLSKKIAGLLGGEIKAEGEFGKGSVFAFTLPLKYQEVKI